MRPSLWRTSSSLEEEAPAWERQLILWDLGQEHRGGEECSLGSVQWAVSLKINHEEFLETEIHV